MQVSRPLPQFILDLLAAMPGRGGGLHNWLFRVARVLHPYRESHEILELLGATTAGEPVRPGEIESAVLRSKSVAWKPGEKIQSRIVQSAWPKIDEKKRSLILSTGASLVDLWEASPVRIDDNQQHCEDIIDVLFPDNPLLCCGTSQSDFDTRTRSEWRGKLAKMAVIVPNAMTARSGPTQGGKESAHALSIVGPRQFLVIEQDLGTIDEQAAVLLHLAQYAPLTVAVHSGSKSIHGWFCCLGQPEEMLRDFMRYAVSLGADHATWCKSQFVRMPDGIRGNGNRQAVYFYQPKAVKS
jgi:hypothetical protein